MLKLRLSLIVCNKARIKPLYLKWVTLPVFDAFLACFITYIWFFMSNITNDSISDASLLLATGFHCVSGVDSARLALFCGVSKRTAQHWLKNGLPGRARAHLINLKDGVYLPDAFRRNRIRFDYDSILLASGHTISLEHLTYWPFIMQCVDWSKAAKLLPK